MADSALGVIALDLDHRLEEGGPFCRRKLEPRQGRMVLIAGGNQPDRGQDIPRGCNPFGAVGDVSWRLPPPPLPGSLLHPVQGERERSAVPDRHSAGRMYQARQAGRHRPALQAHSSGSLPPGRLRMPVQTAPATAGTSRWSRLSLPKASPNMPIGELTMRSRARAVTSRKRSPVGLTT